MSIDTRNKRSSTIMAGLSWRGLYPEPDGTLTGIDLPHIAGLYAMASAEPNELVADNRAVTGVVLRGNSVTGVVLRGISVSGRPPN